MKAGCSSSPGPATGDERAESEQSKGDGERAGPAHGETGYALAGMDAAGRGYSVEKKTFFTSE